VSENVGEEKGLGLPITGKRKDFITWVFTEKVVTQLFFEKCSNMVS